ncbi:MAG TPA: DinB family protein [Thermoanaerobaculia bacterium]|nr:DinB family protein [Thermoanaerobaculia bacterium]
MEPAPVAEPWTAAEIVRDLTAVRAWSARFWQQFDVAEFFAPIGDAWSPADHVRHLVKSNRPVAMALGLPKIVLLLRFGFARRPSAPYSQLVARYHGELAAGLKAGSYAASPLPPERQTAEERQRSLTNLDETAAAVGRALGKWGERALDRLRIPHPAMGPLTVREMAFFTLYHNTHHVLGAARRLETKAS